METPLWRCAVRLDAGTAAALEAEIGDDALAFSRFEDGPVWHCEALLSDRPAAAALGARIERLAVQRGLAIPAVRIETVAPQDWVTTNQATFVPLRVGRYLVHGSHEGRPGPGVRLRIDAGRAFGTGAHASTHGCLDALDRLARAGVGVRNALDLGCGSAILAIAIARTWRVPVIAADNDPAALATARTFVAANGLARTVRCIVSEGYAASAIRTARPFDLITCNILARPLIALAPGLARALAPGGHAVLAGLLTRQVRSVLAAHRGRGLKLVRRIDRDGWSTLVLARGLV